MHFSLLGPLTVQDSAGLALPLSSPKARLLLAMLLLQPNEAVSRDRLVAALWGEDPPATASTALNNQVVQVRRVLAAACAPGEPSRLRTAAPGYLLEVRDGELDAAVFTRRLDTAGAAVADGDWARAGAEAAAALALWRGTPLVDLPTLADASTARIHELTLSHQQALEWHFEAELQLGRHQGLIPELTRAAAEHPLREAFHRQLMLALHRSARTAEALDVHRRLREALVEELGLEPGRAVQAAHQEVLGGAAPQRGGPLGRAAGGAPATSATAISGLPRDVASFTGRSAELHHLLEACQASITHEAGVIGIHAVDGMPGVGKSALAVHAAHRLAAGFPDGQIFLPLHAHTPGTPAVEPADALLGLLLSMGIGPGQIPAGLDARASLWRSRLAGKRILLVLDDARSSRQVAPLLPGTPGSLVLVTSRRRLPALPDAVPVTLDVLPADEAAALFIAKAGRPELTAQDAAVRELVRLCGYLPLALALTAARLRHHRSWTVADLLADLGATSGRLSVLRAEGLSVAAAFDLSYRDLAPDQRGLLRSLGLHVGDDIDARAAAALAGTDLRTARRLLEELEDHHLIEEPVRGRYRMHDLIREHARDLAENGGRDGDGDGSGSGGEGPGARAAAVDRLLDHYLAGAQAADQHIARHHPVPRGSLGARPDTVPDFADLAQADAWLRAERVNLHAAVEYAAAHGRPEHAIALPVAMHEFLRGQGRWHQSRVLHGIALEVADRTGDRTGRADALTNLGVLDSLSCELTLAEERYREALALYLETGEGLGEARVLGLLGDVLYLQNRCEESARSNEQSLERYRALGNRRGEATAGLNLGYVHYLLTQYDQAVTHLRPALELFRVLGYRLGEANSLSALSAVQEILGQYEESAAGHRAAFALFQGLGNRFGQANTLFSLGTVEQFTGQYALSAEHQQAAGEIYREMGYQNGLANTLINLGYVLRVTGRYEQAEAALREALHLDREHGLVRGELNALLQLGHLLLETGRAGTAVEYAEKAVTGFEESEHNLGHARALACLALARHATGDHAGAADALDRALPVSRELAGPAEAEVLNQIGRVALLMALDGRPTDGGPTIVGAPAGGQAGEGAGAAVGAAEQALAHHERALEIVRPMAFPLQQVLALEGIGACLCHLGDADRGHARLREALRLAEPLGTPDAARIGAHLEGCDSERG
ncbi:AfsR/SARP family transcriptional regulator [Kitasatospora sp. NBC_01302]|uniref:AfsR/SARP family transcriptional regulator n=1 Tax=Kitasatospora sp. NBC_01302 TaxID=2903575 RepID=UPI002E158F2B|nr:tetratricopeptide repeat protein [Kitasatospora sp. NBC_01302]